LDRHLAENELNSHKYVSKQSNVADQENELSSQTRLPNLSTPRETPRNKSPQMSPAKQANWSLPPERNFQSSHRDTGKQSAERKYEEKDEEDSDVSTSDSEEISWKPSRQAVPDLQHSFNPQPLSESPPSFLSMSPTLSLNIPQQGFLPGEEDDDESEGEDEESIFLNPEMTPQEIKAMRLKKFGLNYQRSLSTATSPSTPSPSKEDRNRQRERELSPVPVSLHVGTALLDDDDDDNDEEDQESEEKVFKVTTPVKKSSSDRLKDDQRNNGGFSPSATAWMDKR
jgi:hypothetical protein